MKKKLLVLSITSLFLLCACASQGEQGLKGDKGDKGDPGAPGEVGSQGPQGDKGDSGEQGPQGETGPQGPQGETGPAGTDGKTPYIGDNGNWWIGNHDTGVSATGEKGPADAFFGKKDLEIANLTDAQDTAIEEGVEARLKDATTADRSTAVYEDFTHTSTSLSLGHKEEVYVEWLTRLSTNGSHYYYQEVDYDIKDAVPSYTFANNYMEYEGYYFQSASEKQTICMEYEEDELTYLDFADYDPVAHSDLFMVDCEGFISDCMTRIAGSPGQTYFKDANGELYSALFADSYSLSVVSTLNGNVNAHFIDRSMVLLDVGTLEHPEVKEVYGSYTRYTDVSETGVRLAEMQAMNSTMIHVEVGYEEEDVEQFSASELETAIPVGEVFFDSNITSWMDNRSRSDHSVTSSIDPSYDNTLFSPKRTSTGTGSSRPTWSRKSSCPWRIIWGPPTGTTRKK